MKIYEEARLAPKLRSLKQLLIGDIGRTLWVLMGTLGVVLLIVCANTANLLLNRAEYFETNLDPLGILLDLAFVASHLDEGGDRRNDSSGAPSILECLRGIFDQLNIRGPVVSHRHFCVVLERAMGCGQSSYRGR